MNILIYNRNKIIYQYLIFYFIIIGSNVFSQTGNTKVGTTSANFLQMEIGARAIALGGAYVSVADDATALYWNSAGIGLVQNGNAVYQFGSRYADIAHHYAGIVYGLGNDDKIGIMINYVDVGEMEITTMNEPDGTGQNFSASNLAIGLAYARQLTDRVFVGIQAKFIQENIWMESANGFALDFGAIYYIEEMGIRIGMNLCNLGPDMSISGDNLDFYKEKPDDYPGSPTPLSTLSTKEFPLPMVFSMGFSMDLVGQKSILIPSSEHKLLVAIAANDSFDAPFRNNIGIEYSWQNILSLRSGYHIGYDTSDLSFGVGINMERFTSLDVELDYVWNNYGDLGAINVFTLGINF